MVVGFETMSRDLGDFQTPRDLVDEILKVLGPVGELWPRVLEPTCGTGNFVSGLVNLSPPPREILGIELQVAHVRRAQEAASAMSNTSVRICHADLFKMDLRAALRWETQGPLLIIGNPPWVTSSELGGLSSANIPKKRNLRGLRGIDALTGASNFDLAESVIIKLLVELAGEQPTIAMLCKTQVARKVLQYAHEKGVGVSSACVRGINAQKWFSAAVDACLFVLSVGPKSGDLKAEVFSDLHSQRPVSAMGFVGRSLVSDLGVYRRVAAFDGTCSIPWRQGLKHDAASVMELATIGGALKNKLGEIVDVEPAHRYPLLKSSDLFNHEYPVPRLEVIVTQKRIGEDTAKLAEEAPKLWDYLQTRRDFFSRRKSSVYKGRPEFSVFGVGEYTFSPYKIAVAGLYEPPRFRLIRPIEDRPVLLDDTCYFLPCSSLRQAVLILCLLNDESCRNLIQALTFRAAKRPVKKAVLQRIGLAALLGSVNRQELESRFAAIMSRIAEDQSPEHGFPKSPESLINL
jgi:hypothetical protein